MFTGNNLIVMAWASGKISTTEVLRNWLIVYCCNLVGSLGLVILVLLSHHPDFNGGRKDAALLGSAPISGRSTDALLEGAAGADVVLPIKTG